MVARMEGREDRLQMVTGGLRSVDPAERELAVDLVALLGEAEAVDLLPEAGSVELDPLLRLKIARVLAGAGDRRGLRLAVDLLEEGVPLLVRDEARQFLSEETGQEFGYDAFADGEVNQEAIARWREWVSR
jgi:hypothetical protein